MTARTHSAVPAGTEAPEPPPACDDPLTRLLLLLELAGEPEWLSEIAARREGTAGAGPAGS